jgi:anaerobic selenocysteine-containing dehydrogenase
VYTHVTSFATHKPASIISDKILPIKSLYEKDSFTFNIEGRLRKMYKAVTAPTNTRSVESFLIALCRISFLPKE